MNNFCFSDIHGHIELFEKIMKWLNSQEEEWRCIFLGDACDRMGAGYEIIKAILNDSRFVYIKGNHEDMFANAMLQLKRCWSEENIKVPTKCSFDEAYELIHPYYYYDEVSLHIRNGGLPTLLSWVQDGAPGNLIFELNNLPEAATLEVNGTIFELTHAGHLIDESDSPIWSREHFNEKWEDGIMVHGHTPILSLMKYVIINPASTCRPAFYQDGTKIDMDTACFSSNTINVLNLNTLDHMMFTALI